jgi:exodeoxyribonuclease V alpha subunit
MGVVNVATKDEQVVIEGIVTRILFKDDKANSAIIAFKSDGIPDFARDSKYPNNFVGIGSFLRVVEGQKFNLTGTWTKHTKYGWRFTVKYYEEVMPNSREAIIEYLSSGLFKGIGKKTATNIVDKFGEDAIDIIKNDPKQLSTIRGISSGKASAIVDSYRKSEHLEKLMLSLKPYHIPTGKIVKISQQYGDNAMEKIIANPYRLCDDIEGIGFKTADAIARVCGINPNDDFRIRAGIIYTLNECANAEGHVYLPFDVMVQKAQKVLQGAEIQGEVDKNNIIRVSIDMNNAKDLIIESDSSVYLPLYHASETMAAKKVKLILNAKPRKFNYNINTTITELEQKYKIKYADKQKEAFKTMPSTNMMVITGGPGTGKTTIIKGIIDIFKKNFSGCKISLCAPTGRAAKRMQEATKLEAKTIHRLLEYRPSSDGVFCGRDEKNPIDADLIIMDESSMVDILLFATFLRAVKPNTMLIMVGDTDQLPSVGAGNVLKDVIASGIVPVVYLNEIFRQKDTSKIIINSSKINHGEDELEYAEDFVFIEEKDPNNIPCLISEYFKKELMRVKDINEVQVLSPFRKKTETGVDQLNIVLQDDLNPKASNKPELHYGQRVFRRYDKVMQYKNNYDKEVFNGDIGIIQNVDFGNSTLLIKMEDEEVEFFKDELDELQLAYATTIHKSQGCEYDTVIIPLSMQHKRMLQRNLVYTGITRAKKKVVLIGDLKALKYAIRNNRINSRFSKLDERIIK